MIHGSKIFSVRSPRMRPPATIEARQTVLRPIRLSSPTALTSGVCISVVINTDPVGKDAHAPSNGSPTTSRQPRGVVHSISLFLAATRLHVLLRCNRPAARVTVRARQRCRESRRFLGLDRAIRRNLLLWTRTYFPLVSATRHSRWEGLANSGWFGRLPV